MHQHIGEGDEVQTELVGTHRVVTGAVGKQVELLFLDPVFHVASGAVEFLVQRHAGEIYRLSVGGF